MNVFFAQQLQPGLSSQSDVLLGYFSVIYWWWKRTVGRSVAHVRTSLNLGGRTKLKSLWQFGTVFLSFFVWILSAFCVEAHVCLGYLYSAIQHRFFLVAFLMLPPIKCVTGKETIKPPSFADAETWRCPPAPSPSPPTVCSMCRVLWCCLSCALCVSWPGDSCSTQTIPAAHVAQVLFCSRCSFCLSR